MTSEITITPIENLDFELMKVIDESKITIESYDTYLDKFTFYNKVLNEERVSSLIEVSLYNDYIVRENTKFKILHMMSKSF